VWIRVRYLGQRPLWPGMQNQLVSIKILTAFCILRAQDTLWKHSCYSAVGLYLFYCFCSTVF
jgi:hypothetical protein